MYEQKCRVLVLNSYPDPPPLSEILYLPLRYMVESQMAEQGASGDHLDTQEVVITKMWTRDCTTSIDREEWDTCMVF